MSNFDDIRVMREHYKLHNPIEFDEDQIMDDEWLDFRMKLLIEELNEIKTAMNKSDPVELFDGLLDLVVVAMGTAAGLGFNWELGWDEVHRSNMDKSRGPAEQTKRNNSLDLIKGPNWKSPELDRILDTKIQTSSFSIAKQIRRKKKSDYQKDEITLEEYFPFGLLSYVQMIHIKSTRLRSLAQSNNPVNESIEDTLLDMLNYVDFTYNFVVGDES
tara:strand:+ start:385 stop:1032 length:648 start_codon:yes stop_codon:yes gene_type:complete